MIKSHNMYSLKFKTMSDSNKCFVFPKHRFLVCKEHHLVRRLNCEQLMRVCIIGPFSKCKSGKHVGSSEICVPYTGFCVEKITKMLNF